MDWENLEYRAALLKLWVARVLGQTRKVRPLVEYLLELGWITQTTRHKELALNELGRDRLPALLDRVWPEWRQTLRRLHEADLPPTAVSLVELARRSGPPPTFPGRLHHKTYAAMERLHSKSPTSGKTLPRDLTLTTDGVLRIRANEGLVLCLGAHRLSCDGLMAVAGEVIIPERAFMDGVHPCGVLPRVVMTVENLGPFVDMPRPEGLLLVHQPGWNTPLSLRLLGMLALETPWYHFGDLDPEGIAIFRHLNREVHKAELFLPSFWDEYAEGYSHPLPGGWPDGMAESFSGPLLKSLFANNAWLEQEPILLDERLDAELVRLLSTKEASMCAGR